MFLAEDVSAGVVIHSVAVRLRRLRRIDAVRARHAVEVREIRVASRFCFANTESGEPASGFIQTNRAADGDGPTPTRFPGVSFVLGAGVAMQVQCRVCGVFT